MSDGFFPVPDGFIRLFFDGGLLILMFCPSRTFIKGRTLIRDPRVSGLFQQLTLSLSMFFADHGFYFSWSCPCVHTDFCTGNISRIPIF